MSTGPIDGGEELLRNCDLYLHWAFDSTFNYMPKGSCKEPSVGLLIKWDGADAADRAAVVVRELAIPVPGVYLGSTSGARARKARRIWALTVPRRLLVGFLREAGSLAARIELAMPMDMSTLRPVSQQGLRSESTVLAAVLDDGCAFANARFRHVGGTRVLWLWDQDLHAVGPPAGTGSWPSPEADFGYGAQFCKSDLDDAYAKAGNAQDAAYQRTGLASMRHRATHGAHVMDLLANTDPPWPANTDPWQIVFVQFPRAGVEDPSGIWLKRHALDGLNYVAECAGPKTRMLAVNISWGPQTGPHDGHSVLEEGIAELKQLQHDVFARELVVTLPAGNSFGAQAHACIGLAGGADFDWHVPPDGTLPAFVELWWPEGSAPDQVALWITPPGSSVPVRVVPDKNVATDRSWWARLKVVDKYTRVLVVVNPTRGTDPDDHPPGPPGPHGRWHFKIEVAAGTGPVHAYVARADHNMGARRRAKASYLSDGPLMRARFAAPACRDKDVPCSVIRRTGTLNGMATGTATWTAAGYVNSSGAPARYSSAGPTLDPSVLKPDFACVTDRSPACAGLRATGSRTGTTAVLVGTSTAAPQLARRLALDNLTTQPDPLPGPVPPEQLGKGRLIAQPWLLKR